MYVVYLCVCLWYRFHHSNRILLPSSRLPHNTEVMLLAAAGCCISCTQMKYTFYYKCTLRYNIHKNWLTFNLCSHLSTVHCLLAQRLHENVKSDRRLIYKKISIFYPAKVNFASNFSYNVHANFSPCMVARFRQHHSNITTQKRSTCDRNMKIIETMENE